MVVKNSKVLMFFSKLKYRGFEVADYDLATRLSKFQLADPIWRLKIRKKSMRVVDSGLRNEKGPVRISVSNECMYDCKEKSFDNK